MEHQYVIPPESEVKVCSSEDSKSIRSAEKYWRPIGPQALSEWLMPAAQVRWQAFEHTRVSETAELEARLRAEALHQEVEYDRVKGETEARDEQEEAARKKAEADRMKRERLLLERLQLERIYVERQRALSSFLTDHNFKDVTLPRTTLMETTYPLHHAAKLANEQMVAILLMEGADANQKKCGR